MSKLIYLSILLVILCSCGKEGVRTEYIEGQPIIVIEPPLDDSPDDDENTPPKDEELDTRLKVCLKARHDKKPKKCIFLDEN